MKKESEIFIVPTKYGKGAFGFTDDRKDYFYSFCPEGKFPQWLEQIIKEHPYARMRCVFDDDITKWLELRKQQDDLFAKKIIMNNLNDR